MSQNPLTGLDLSGQAGGGLGGCALVHNCVVKGSCWGCGDFWSIVHSVTTAVAETWAHTRSALWTAVRDASNGATALFRSLVGLSNYVFYHDFGWVNRHCINDGLIWGGSATMVALAGGVTGWGAVGAFAGGFFGGFTACEYDNGYI